MSMAAGNQVFGFALWMWFVFFRLFCVRYNLLSLCFLMFSDTQNPCYCVCICAYSTGQVLETLREPVPGAADAPADSTHEVISPFFQRFILFLGFLDYFAVGLFGG